MFAEVECPLPHQYIELGLEFNRLGSASVSPSALFTSLGAESSPSALFTSLVTLLCGGSGSSDSIIVFAQTDLRVQRGRKVQLQPQQPDWRARLFSFLASTRIMKLTQQLGRQYPSLEATVFSSTASINPWEVVSSTCFFKCELS